MASVFYGMCGEGRGHATRARAVIESLRGRHQITLFASDDALALLGPIYRGTDVRVVEIPGLHFAYTAAGRVALGRTLLGALQFQMAVGGYVRDVLPEFERGKPDLVLADFEPVLPRAARRLGVPFVSFDHQHYLVVSDFGGLPFGLRQEAALAAPCVRALYHWQVDTIVSSFYRPPLKPRWRDATQVGVLIRPEMQSLVPAHGRHVVAYVRRFAEPAFLAALAGCGREVRIYGLGARPSTGNLRFCAIDERRFMDDLAGCAAVVSTAGNQLVGEALYLGKPVLVQPERRNFEQSVNAHFLEQGGAGWVERGALTAARVGAFLEALPLLRSRIRKDEVYGNLAAVAAINRHLDGGVPLPRPQAAVARRGPREGVQWA